MATGQYEDYLSHKGILYTLHEENVIDMTCSTKRFGVSFMVLGSATAGMNKFVSAWNSHFIAGMPNLVLSLYIVHDHIITR